MVWSIFLNDVEEGGETEFLYHSMRVKAKKGSMLLFPAGFTHLHRGNPPMSNTKYIATGWYVLTQPRNIIEPQGTVGSMMRVPPEQN